MTTLIEHVRRHIGRRHRINRDEMAMLLHALIIECRLDVQNDYMARSKGHPRHLPVPAPTVAEAWAEACRDITCVSVVADESASDKYIRYDQPGSIDPMMHATLMFAPDGLDDYDYLRQHCDRLLIVEETRS